MAASTYFRSFSAGELSPALASRADLPVYGAGLRRCRNFLIGRHGGAINRPGTLFVGACKTASADVRLVRYVHETPGESILLEVGVSYIRFYRNGTLVAIDPGDFEAYDNGDEYTPGMVVSSGVDFYICTATTTGNAPPNATYWTELTATNDDGDIIYEVPTPFTLPRATKWTQSGRVITFTHQAVQPRDLTYVAVDHWRLELVTTASGVDVPQSVAIAQAADEVDITYDVRAVTVASGAGNLSTAFTDTFGPPSPERPITITWDAPAGGETPDYYEVFKNGFLLGTTDELELLDYGQFVGEPWTPGIGGETVDPPTNVDATQGAATPLFSTFRYVVTAIVAGEESFASAVADEDLEAPTVDRPHTLSWTAVTNASGYNVYADPNGNGVFGFVGSSVSNAFSYPGLPLPDYTHTPPTNSNFFAGSQYPAVSGYFQQRRFFANTPTEPDVVKASRTGQPTNFSVSIPLQDQDALRFRLIGAQQHAVRALVAAMGGFLVFTDGGEWRALTGPDSPLTPDNLPFDQETSVGMHDEVRAVIVGGRVVYVQARGRKVVELYLAQPTETGPGQLAGRDLTPFASHLVDGFTLTALDYQYEPHSIVWACRNDGALLGLTYLPALEVFGWHRHDTAGGLGLFEDVCVVPEDNVDTVYVIVSREIDSETVRYIERLASREAALVFADAAVQYTGSPISTLEGLDHLEGETVAVFADGAVRDSQVVDGGAIALGGSYSTVVAGLAIEADLETLDLDAPGSNVRSRKKVIPAVQLLLDASSRNFQAGPDTSNLKRYAAPATEDPNNGAFTGLVELAVTARQGFSPRIWIRHDKPTPLTVLGLLPDVEVGG